MFVESSDSQRVHRKISREDVLFYVFSGLQPNLLVGTYKSFDGCLVAQISESVVISQDSIDRDDERSLLEVNYEDLLNSKVKSIEVFLELPGQLGIIDLHFFLGRKQHLYLDVQGRSWLVTRFGFISMDDCLID